MGQHVSRPVLPKGTLEQILTLAVQLVDDSPFASRERICRFASEVSRWAQAGGGQEALHWHRGARQLLGDEDAARASASSRRMLGAFHRPCLLYAASRGALAAWPEVWRRRSPSPELVAAVRSVDVRAARGWWHLLELTLGAMAWTALQDAATRMLKLAHSKKLQRRFHTTVLMFDNTDFWDSLDREHDFLELAVVIVAQSRVRGVLRGLEEEGRLAGSTAGASAAAAAPLVAPLQRPRTWEAMPCPSRSTGVERPNCFWLGVLLADCQAPLLPGLECDLLLPCRRGGCRRGGGGDAYDDERIAEGVCTLPPTPRWREGETVSARGGFRGIACLPQVAAAAKAAAPGLLKEFKTLWARQRKEFLPWREGGVPVAGWWLFGTHLFGYRLEDNCDRAPVAAQLAEATGATMCGYSVLLPRTHIEPHCEDGGSSAMRIHVGLVVPETSGRCALRVGKEVTIWSPGELTIFDATEDHEAWNFSSQLRAVLLLDVGSKVLDQEMWPGWLCEALAGLAELPAGEARPVLHVEER